MIRDDILNSLSGRNLSSIFTKERVFDIETYYIGEVNGNLYCYNKRTGKVMDYFFDDRLDIEWFSLSKYVNAEINTVNEFLINREGTVVKRTKKGTLVKKTISRAYKDDYPYYAISRSSYGGCIRIAIHRALAKIFIPTLMEDDLECLMVDHINRNIEDYSLNNLRWVTASENRQNTIKIDYIDRYRYEAYVDRDMKTLDRIYTEKEIYDSKMSKGYLITRADTGKICYGYYWRIIPKEVEMYLDGETIDPSLWKLHYSGKYWVHPLGIIGCATRNVPVKSGKDLKSSSLSVGTFRGGYRRYNGAPINRIVAETFLNGNKPINADLQVDHIDTDRGNNRVNNLRICTKAENMNNELTLLTRRNRVLVDGVEYSSFTECGKALGIHRSIVAHRIKSDLYPNYKLLK